MDTTTRRNRRAALAALLSCGVLAATAAGLACAATPPAAPPGQPVIVVLGDSLSAEYGLPRDTGWVALLRQRLATERIDYSVANASVSGDTTSGGRAPPPP
ncbi:SGNH/GDSL hydrolase family protein, partial [Burkholderia ubonensis]|uniref:SGNH/GDSL hydrolase family protein n=1 Tax=Burkholderia ubonensis TaxID=101571 RepID=UPI002FCB34EE